MKNRIAVAVVLLSALLLGPVHADTGADTRAALVLIELGIDSFRSILFHFPDPRIAFQHKSDELLLLDRHLLRIAREGDLTQDAKDAIIHNSTVMAAITTGVPNGELTPEQVVDWQEKQLNALKNLRAAVSGKAAQR